jgi:superfamily II DNA or RNA helicase
MKRLFNKKQKAALFILSQGKCSECKAQLKHGWHADHVKPFIHGGETDVLNGQALCPDCNLKKGARMVILKPWPTQIELREWQQNAVEKFYVHSEKNFLAVATPGAGKTIFALKCAHLLLSRGLIKRIVIVCPSENLKDQWADEAAALGIQINASWDNSMWTDDSDFHGMVITYQQVTANPEVHRMLCSQPTLVIFDEIHHAGEGKSWGDNLRTAFDPAVKRLLLSGTPFRHDNLAIPYVTYEKVINKKGQEVMISRTDFSYGYGAALSDQEVCRNVVFSLFDGVMEWFSDGEVKTHDFKTPLEKHLASQRLKTALSPGGGWLDAVLKEANTKLTSIRNAEPQFSHRDAAGLVIAMDISHATAIAEIMTKLTGETPVIVNHNDPDASTKIKQFKTSSDKWIIAVRMVSEGVDIKRLRVCVYATNIMTELFFIQAVGRVLRWIRGLEEQTAYFYIPREDVLMEYAARIKAIQEHQLQEEVDKLKKEFSSERESKEPIQLKLYAPISSTGREDDVIYNHNTYTTEQRNTILGAAAIAGLSKDTPFSALAEFIRQITPDYFTGHHVPKPAETVDPQPAEVRKDQQKANYRKTINDLVKKLARTMQSRASTDVPFSDIMKHIWRKLGETDNVYPVTNCTLEQLQARLLVIDRWNKEVGQNDGQSRVS